MRGRWLLVLGLFWLIAAPLAAAPLKVNTSLKPPFSTAQQDGFFDLLLEELFARVGVEYQLVRLPAERALQLVNDGYSDADLPRIAGLDKKYPNLLPVPEPLIDYNFVAFMKAPGRTDIDWQKLAGEQVGLIIGWKIYENNVPQGAELLRANSPQQLFQLLDHGRVRFALYERYAGQYLLKTEQLSGIVEAAPPLAVRPMFIYLNRKDQQLLEPLAAELRKMKRDGSWQRIAVQTLGR